MKIQKSENLNSSEKIDIFNIWNSAYPSQIVYKGMEDFEKYLSSRKNPMHLLLKNNSHVIGWLCIFDRNSERWFAMIVDPNYQRQGIGKMLMQQMQQMENTVNGWIVMHDKYAKIDGTPYLSPRSFYQSHNFIITDEKLETDMLSTVKIRWTRST